MLLFNELQYKLIKSLVLVAVFFQQVKPQPPANIRFSDFVGINSNVAAYDQKYLSDLSKCTKWMREYHSWGHYEVADNYYKWDNITTFPQGYTWPDHNKFMDECKRLGINVLIDALNKPSWAGSARGAYSTGDGTKPSDYLDKLEFLGQLVARYGSVKHDKSLLETADKVTGLNYIKYYEDDNEPDYWWENPQWPAEKYAVYCNAAHDGYGVSANAAYPLLGIKSVDPNAKHVLAGLAKNDSVYIQKILNASKGRIPFDVINIHTYCTDNKNGYSPEHESFGLEKKLENFMNWRNRVLPQIPVWITEFGWDTYMTQNQSSYVYAPIQQQANYIVRSYFILLKMGFEKAFLFMDKDPGSKSTVQYSSSGIITDSATGHAKKTSFYYLATLQRILGNAKFSKIVSFREQLGSTEIFCFEFVNDASEKIYVFWARRKNSSNDDGTIIKYTFNLDYIPEYAYSVFLKDKNMEGEKSENFAARNSIDLILNETPQFLVVSSNKTSFVPDDKKILEINTFPNPSGGNIAIKLYLSKSNSVNLMASDIHGKTTWIIRNQILNNGTHTFSFGENIKSGLYCIRVESGNISKVSKVFIQ